MEKYLEFSNSSKRYHSLPIMLANELLRMRQRIATIPAGINGISHISKSLDRLEEELKSIGYELPNLLKKTYNEGMTVQARFIPSNDLKPGERIICKVIKPQVNYNGQLIQAAEVEVSIGI